MVDRPDDHGEDRTPLDDVVELLVYAPLGLALSAREQLPDWIAKGRERLDGQLALAKMMGQFAVQQGQSEVQRLFESSAPVTPVPESAPAEPVPAPPTPEPSETTPARPKASKKKAAKKKATAASATKPKASKKKTAKAKADPAPVVGELAIPDYDSLAASQVVPRLAGLGADDLEAVARYEAANRGRKTILNKVRQLQAS